MEKILKLNKMKDKDGQLVQYKKVKKSFALFGKTGTTKRIDNINKVRYYKEGYLVLLMIPSDNTKELKVK